MSRFVSLTLMAGLASTTLFGIAQQAAPKINNVPIQQTSVASGPQMYATYCATCHGQDGKGNGPAAKALKIPPVDLTTLSQKNGGVFPSNHVNSVLQFGVENPAHGSASMPIWGNLMLTLHAGSSNPDVQVHQRIINLTDYLKKIQK
jgi:mono/diheme cytochrome c family protein